MSLTPIHLLYWKNECFHCKSHEAPCLLPTSSNKLLRKVLSFISETHICWTKGAHITWKGCALKVPWLPEDQCCDLFPTKWWFHRPKRITDEVFNALCVWKASLPHALSFTNSCLWTIWNFHPCEKALVNTKILFYKSFAIVPTCLCQFLSFSYDM